MRCASSCPCHIKPTRTCALALKVFCVCLCFSLASSLLYASVTALSWERRSDKRRSDKRETGLRQILHPRSRQQLNNGGDSSVCINTRMRMPAQTKTKSRRSRRKLQHPGRPRPRAPARRSGRRRRAGVPRVWRASCQALLQGPRGTWTSCWRSSRWQRRCAAPHSYPQLGH